MPFLFCLTQGIEPSLRKMNKVVILTVIMLQISSGNSVKSPLAPALYVFGDSLFDSGNNNLLPTLAKADYSPYGMDFKGGHTGRFTNGRTLVDFIAEFLGLPYAPPYLSFVRPLLQSQPLTGLNFASSSCGILPETGRDLGKCLHLVKQVDLFERTIQELPQHYHLNSVKLSDYMSQSVFLISIGSNDYLNNYLDSRHYDSRKLFSPQSFAKLLVDNLSLQFERLYELGARKVVMFEIGPIGCIPSIVRTRNHSGKCVEEINDLAVMFNDELASMMKKLMSNLQGSTFVLGRAHSLGYDTVINPSKYGLSDSSNACCVTWLNGTSACIPGLKALACRHPNKHYFFDGYHPTENVFGTIATRCFNDSSICTPKSIKELVVLQA